MLALTRKVGERIVIDDHIVLTIVDIRGDNIRIAIEAPRNIKIYRGELYDSIVAENQKAAAPMNDAGMDLLKGIHAKQEKK